MKFVLRHKVEITLLLLLGTLYFVLRLPNLTSQPIFADEAIYIRWAQVMKSEPTLRFLPLSDGKTPLFMWIMMPLFKVFQDPLYAGRFLSVVSGIFTLLGVFLLSRKIFNQKVAFLAAFLYVITPYLVFFDRLALVDSMLAGFSIWSLYLLVLFLQKPALDKSIILGYFLGAAVLVKTPGMLNIMLTPLAVFAFLREKSKEVKLLKFLLYLSASIIIALVLYNLLRLGPGFQQLSSRNTDYLFSPLELVGRPLDPFIPHFHDISDWFPRLLTWPILIFGLIGIGFAVLRLKTLELLLLAWGLIPFLLEMTFLRTFTARYLLSAISPFIVFSAYGVDNIINKLKIQKFYWLVIGLLSILPIIFNYFLITDISKASLPKEERKGYLEEWTAGYGFSDIAKYLIDKRKKGTVVVATQGFFGTLPDGLYIYLDKADIMVVGSSATISAQIREAAKTHQTFFVGNKKDLKQDLKDVVLINEYPKYAPLDGGKQDAVVFYQVLPHNEK